jgi:repressor LexA
MGRTPAGETRGRILAFIRERILAGVPPTLHEIQEEFGFATVRTVQEHVEKLVHERALVREPRVSRGFRLPAAEQRERQVEFIPVLGRVAAGPLAAAVEELEGHIAIQPSHRGKDFFALRVRGESMKDIGILHGDLVVVRRQPTAESGEIVVALVGDEATVKRLVKKKRRLELHAANSAFSSIVPKPEDVRILGKVVEVRRFLETTRR